MKMRFFAGLAGAAILAGCTNAGGSGDTALAADYGKAADALIAKLGPGKPIPPATDPDVRAYEAQASKATAAIGTDALPATSFDTFGALCGKATTIIQAYLHGGAAGEASPEAMNANAVRYIDQLFTPLLFSARCTAAHLPFVETTLSEQDLKDKPQAVQQIRGGAFGQATGLLQIATDPSLDAPRRKRAIDLLAGDAGKFAIVFNAEQRRQLADAARQAQATLPPELKSQAERISTDIASAPCGKLCTA